MLLDGDEAYTKAKEMLAKRFGDPFTVVASFRKRLEEWKQIAPGDAIVYESTPTSLSNAKRQRRK
jgi:hypothetical protein